jgi:hypothetical protein
MSAVQARIHYTMKQEFKLLASIIRDNTPDDYDYQPEVGNKKAKQADYSVVDVIPVSDPNAATMSQRVVQYQAVLQLSQTAPQIYDLPYLHRQMIENLGVKNASKIIPTPEDLKPVDPVSENMAIINGKPVKAFIYQDHEAHLAVHTSFLQDPKIAAQMGQNPQAQALLAAAQAHIMEHVAFQYRRDIEKQLGAALPPMPTEDGENTLPAQIEVELSQLAAQAAAKLLQKDVAEAQAQQAAQQMQDPLVQMQMQDLQIKQQEAQRKAAQMQVDSQIKAAEQQRKVQKDQQDFLLKNKELEIKQEEVENRTHTEGVRMGIDIGKTREMANRPPRTRE